MRTHSWYPSGADATPIGRPRRRTTLLALTPLLRASTTTSLAANVEVYTPALEPNCAEVARDARAQRGRCATAVRAQALAKVGVGLDEHAGPIVTAPAPFEGKSVAERQTVQCAHLHEDAGRLRTFRAREELLVHGEVLVRLRI